MQFTNLVPLAIALLTSMPSVAASAIPTDLAALSDPSAPFLVSRAVPKNEQSCKAKQKGALIASYGVNIGVPYNRSYCNRIFGTLQEANVGVSNWQCRADNQGDYQLYFNAATGLSHRINGALEERFKSVNRFNCPDY